MRPHFGHEKTLQFDWLHQAVVDCLEDIVPKFLDGAVVGAEGVVEGDLIFRQTELLAAGLDLFEFIRLAT